MVDLCAIFISIITDPSNLIAFCALLVSGFSFFLTVYTIWTQRTHDRLSVKPLANFHLDNLPDHITITIKNNGLGPMIIKSIESFKVEDIHKQNLGWPPNTFNKNDYTDINSMPLFTSGLNNASILNGKSMVIFNQNFDTANPKHLIDGDKTRKAFKNLRIKIKYTSFFEDEEYERIFNPKNLDEVEYFEIKRDD